MADYDLNDVADALAARFNGVDGWIISGQQVEVTATAEAGGVANVPAAVLELDSVDWDVSMARGADAAVFLLYLLVSSSDSGSGQRLTRQLLSSGNLATSLRDSLDNGDRTLGGLISYAAMGSTRTIGVIDYAGARYLGATIEIAVMLQ